MKHIHRIADIVKEDVIEFLVWLESLLKLLFVRKSHREFEGRISLLCDFHNLGADIDTFAVAWPDGSQNVAGIADRLLLLLHAGNLHRFRP